MGTSWSFVGTSRSLWEPHDHCGNVIVGVGTSRSLWEPHGHCGNLTVIVRASWSFVGML